jgi:adhesin transport system outer membrane protein
MKLMPFFFRWSLVACMLGAWVPPALATNDRLLAAPRRTLDSLLQQAQESHPTIRYSQMAREAATLDLSSAKLKFMPSVSVSRQQGSLSYDGQQSSRVAPTTLTLTQPLFQGGALEAGQQKANARLSGAHQGLREARQEVGRKLISAYGDWLRAWTKIRALEDNVALHEKLAGLISRRVGELVAPRIDADLAEARLMIARADLQAQRTLQNAALSSIGQLVGEPLQHADLVGAAASVIPPPPFEQALEKALQASPAMERLGFEAEAAREESREIRAQALPQVALQLQRQVGNATGSSLPGYSAVMLMVSYASGNGFATLRTAEAAQTRAEAAKLQVEMARRELIERLTADFNEYEHASLRFLSLQKSVELSGEISGSYDRQYLVGRKSWMDLMNAVREQAQNRVALADAEVTLLVTSRRIAIYVNGIQPVTAPEVTPLAK